MILLTKRAWGAVLHQSAKDPPDDTEQHDAAKIRGQCLQSALKHVCIRKTL